MTPVQCFANQRIALFGLGGSGLITAQALNLGGALLDVWDDSEVSRAKAAALGLNLVDLSRQDWSHYKALILTPGVPLTHPEPHWSAIKARAAGVEIIGDIELFVRERANIAPNAPFIAITGTNGKSTTTALITHILREAKFDVQMGGNIGIAILALEPPSDNRDHAANRVHVIECSSYQIDLAPSLNPSVGVLLNITPDHIDRHGTFANYAAVKQRLVTKSTLAVIAVDDDATSAIADQMPKAIRVSAKALADVYFNAGLILDKSGNVLADLTKASALRGQHNGQNAVAAFAACAALGVAHATIAAAFLSFPGLAHRMEQVAKVGDVLFINDSKATNADAAEKALLSFDTIYWIIGGKAKDGGIAPLASLFPKIVKAYLIGAASDEFAATLTGKVPFEHCGTLDVATQSAARDAAASQKPAVVLLAPACASFDQYPNFEVRGDAFRAQVQNLAQAKNLK